MQVTSTHGGSTAKSLDAKQPEKASGIDGAPSRPERSGSKNLQTTLANPIHCQGIALHSGVTVDLVLSPAPANTGVRFQRSDIEGSPSFPALYNHIVDTRLSTVVACETDPSSLRVATIEHLMAALSACEIDNILVTVSGPELPVLDGASDAFTFLIRCAGRKTLETPRQIIEILRNVRVEGENGAFAELRPAQRGLSLAVSLSFPAQAIGNQRYAIQLDERRFMEELAFCRTFVNRKDIEYLQSIGLARGGSLETAVVVDGENILNPAGLKIEREFARHKLLDAIGDLYCAGYQMQAGFIGHKSGHTLNNKLLRAVFSDTANWRFVPTGLSRTATKTIRARIAA